MFSLPISIAIFVAVRGKYGKYMLAKYLQITLQRSTKTTMCTNARANETCTINRIPVRAVIPPFPPRRITLIEFPKLRLVKSGGPASAQNSRTLSDLSRICVASIGYRVGYRESRESRARVAARFQRSARVTENVAWHESRPLRVRASDCIPICLPRATIASRTAFATEHDSPSGGRGVFLPHAFPGDPFNKATVNSRRAGSAAENAPLARDGPRDKGSRGLSSPLSRDSKPLRVTGDQLSRSAGAQMHARAQTRARTRDPRERERERRNRPAQRNRVASRRR